MINIIISALNISDRFKKIDIRDYKKIFIYLKKNKLKVAGISSIITEHSLKTINYLSPKLNLPKTSNLSVKASESKYFARKLFNNSLDGKIKFLRTDKFKKFRNFLIQNNKKFILKPDVSSGQRGLYLLDNETLNLKDLLKNQKFFNQWQGNY